MRPQNYFKELSVMSPEFHPICYYLLVNVQSNIVISSHGNLIVVYFWASSSRPGSLHLSIVNRIEVSFNLYYLCIQTAPFNGLILGY